MHGRHPRFPLLPLLLSALAPAARAAQGFSLGDAAFAAMLAEPLGRTTPPPTLGAPVAGQAPLRAKPFPWPYRTTRVLIINGDDAGKKVKTHRDNALRAAAYLGTYYQTSQVETLGADPAQGAERLATRANILARAEALRKTLTDQDQLVVYTTGHGDLRNYPRRWELVLVGNERMRAIEFSKEFLDNRAARIVYVGDQCYSGGFADAMVSGRSGVVAISSTDASTTAMCEYFGPHFFPGLLEAVSDLDADGRVTEAEAFRRLRASKENARAQYLTSK